MRSLNLKETIKSIRLADWLLTAIFIIIPLAGMVFINSLISSGSNVIIEVEGIDRYKYPLSEDRVVHIKSSYGSLNVEIRGGKVRVIGTSCANKLCERQGWLDKGAIICLPNRISITVGGSQEQKDRTVDAITG